MRWLLQDQRDKRLLHTLWRMFIVALVNVMVFLMLSAGTSQPLFSLSFYI